MTRKDCVMLLAAFASAIFWLAPQLAFADGNLQKVNHIIVVMQENHSFDNYFGVLALAPGSPYHPSFGACSPFDHKCVDGLACFVDHTGNYHCANFNPDADNNNSLVFAFHDPTRCTIPDLDRSWLGTHKEMNFEFPNATRRFRSVACRIMARNCLDGERSARQLCGVKQHARSVRWRRRN